MFVGFFWQRWIFMCLKCFYIFSGKYFFPSHQMSNVHNQHVALPTLTSKKDSFQLIFLYWDGDNTCRNSPLATSSYLGIELQSLSLCLKNALFLLVMYLFLLKIYVKFWFKVRKRRWCNWGDVGLLLCCLKLSKWPFWENLSSLSLYQIFFSSEKRDKSTSSEERVTVHWRWRSSLHLLCCGQYATDKWLGSIHTWG